MNNVIRYGGQYTNGPTAGQRGAAVSVGLQNRPSEKFINKPSGKKASQYSVNKGQANLGNVDHDWENARL